MLQECASAGSEQAKHAFVSEHINILISQGDEIMQYYRNFDDFFKIFLLLIDCADEETWPSVFFNFLLSYVLGYGADVKRQHHMLRAVNLSSLFNVITGLLDSPKKRDAFRPQVQDFMFIERFMISKKHSKAFTEFLLLFSFKWETIVGYLKTYESSITPKTAAGFVIFAQLVSEKTSGALIEFFVNKEFQFVADFLDELCCRTVEYRGSLAEVFDGFVARLFAREDFLENADSLQRIVLLTESLQVSSAAALRILMSQFSNLVKKLESKPKDIPIEYYFEVVRDVVIKGNLQCMLIDQYGSEVFDGIKKISKLSVDCGFDFLIDTVGSSFSDHLFEKVSFQTFLDFAPAEKCDRLLSFLPVSRTQEFFSHSVFSQYARDMFAGTALKKFIIERVDKSNVNTLVEKLWTYELFDRHIQLQRLEFFALAWNILRKFPSMSAYIWEKGIHKLCIQNLRSDKSSPAVAKFLAIFNEAFVFENFGKRSFFGVTYISQLASCYGQIDIKYYLQRAIKSRSATGTGKSGHIMLAASFLRFSKSHSQAVIDLISSNQTTGYVAAFREDKQRHAAELLALACSGADNSSAFRLLLSELKTIQQWNAVYPICMALLRFVDRNTEKELTDIVTGILEGASDTKLFDGPVKQLAVKLVECGYGKPNEWHIRAQSLVNQYLNDDEQRTVLMTFMADLATASL